MVAETAGARRRFGEDVSEEDRDIRRGWKREPFTSASGMHVSVLGR